MKISEGFFQLGPASDRAFVNVRESDRSRMVEARKFCEELWKEFQPYADWHILSDAKNNFHQRFWEMYLGVTLLRNGLKLIKVSNEGPEFYFMSGDKKVWVEAIAPEVGTGDDAVPEPPAEGGYLVPEEQMILRYTHALSVKLEAYEAALRKRIIVADDCFIIAINGRGITKGICCDIEDGAPLWAQACLPFGEYAMEVDMEKREVVGVFHNYRDSIKKKNGSNVSTMPLLLEKYKGVSGVLHSSVDSASRPTEMGADFEFLHNPLALQPIELPVFSFCRQYVFSPESGELQTFERYNLDG